MSEGKRRTVLAALCVAIGVFAVALSGCGGERDRKIEGVAFEDATVTYDAAAHTLRAENLPAGVTASYLPDDGYTDVGVYPVTVTLSGKGFATAELSATLTIVKAENVWVETPACASYEYVGTQTLSPTGRAAFGTVAFSYSADEETWSEQAPSAAGVYAVKATVAATANYSGLSTVMQTEITKRRIEKPDAANEFVYDGTVKTALTEAQSYTITGHKATNAGDYTAVVGLKDKTNTCWADGTSDDLVLDWSIAKADAVITVADLAVKYDQAAHAIVATLNHGECELVYEGNGKTEQGVYTVTVRAAETANYRAAETSATLTITRATHTVTFRQEGCDDVVKEVLDLADLEDVPAPQAIEGYAIRWEDADLTRVTEDRIIHAVATAIEYAIVYETDGGTNGENPVAYTVEQEIRLAKPVKFANTFLGWFADKALSIPTDGVALGSTGDMRFWAKWQPLAVENAKIYQGELAEIADSDDSTFLWLDRSANDDTALYLDFGTLQTVRDVRVLSGKPDGNDSWKGEVRLSSDGITFVSAGKVSGSDEQLLYLAENPISARYLKLTLDEEWVGSPNWVAVRELAINTQKSYLTFGNIELEPSVRTSVTSVTDGRPETYAWFATPSAEEGKESWFLLDLCEIQTIRNAQFLTAKKDSMGDFLKAFRLEYSEDGVTFIETGAYAGLRNLYWTPAEPISARYLRVVNTAVSANGCVIREFSVNFSDAITLGDGFKPYDDVRPGHEITHPSYACDGDASTFLDLEATGEGARTVTLDLGREATATEITVLSGGTWGDGIESCVVSYSSDGVDFAELGTFASDDGEFAIRPDSPVVARYLRITVVNAGWITLREFSAQTV